jgi:hypothetical protein
MRKIYSSLAISALAVGCGIKAGNSTVKDINSLPGAATGQGSGHMNTDELCKNMRLYVNAMDAVDENGLFRFKYYKDGQVEKKATTKSDEDLTGRTVECTETYVSKIKKSQSRDGKATVSELRYFPSDNGANLLQIWRNGVLENEQAKPFETIQFARLKDDSLRVTLLQENIRLEYFLDEETALIRNFYPRIEREQLACEPSMDKVLEWGATKVTSARMPLTTRVQIFKLKTNGKYSFENTSSQIKVFSTDVEKEFTCSRTDMLSVSNTGEGSI